MELNRRSLLNDTYGSLRKLRMPDTAARRRFGIERDIDLIVPLDNSQPEETHERPFAVDLQNKIFSSSALKRLGNKTQVFTRPDNWHVRNRASHTYEVAGIASMIAGILGLNADLCCAIAFGHDVGHPPFGHAGEEYLSTLSGKTFRHEIFAAVILQHIERDGAGLNLTRQVLHGIVSHSGVPDNLETEHLGDGDISQEARVVMLSDKIAYVIADWEDLERTGLSLDGMSDIRDMMRSLGDNSQERIRACITALCLESAEKGKISFSTSEQAQSFAQARKLMRKIYPLLNCSAAASHLSNVHELIMRVELSVQPVVALALMTDEEVLQLSTTPNVNILNLHRTSLADLLPTLRGKEIDFTAKDLDW